MNVTKFECGAVRLVFVSIMSCVLANAGCGTEQDGIESVSSALGVSGQPQGLTCGVGYYRNYQNVLSGFCEGASTANATSSCSGGTCTYNFTYGPAAVGWHVAADGDRGLAAPWGIYHQALTSSTGSANAANSAQLLLPKGTTCGFKDNCNDNGELCLGFDAAHSCPSGWTMRVASDSNAPGSCNGGPGGYVWCEYQDPNNLCTGSCQLTDQPSGVVCGMDDNDRHNGQCLGVQTDSGCPSGWTHEGWYDDGRSVGHGLAWCTKS